MKCALIHHLFYPEELIERELPQNIIPCGFALKDKEEVKSIAGQKILVECESVMEFTSVTGQRCIIKEWAIPLTPQVILGNQSQALDMTVAACRNAREWGARLVGLGLMLGKIGSRGQAVSNKVDVAVTNGDSYLIFNAVQIMMQLVSMIGLNPMDLHIAVFGFPSTIGTYLTKYLLSMGINVVLIARKSNFILSMVKRITESYGANLNLVSSFAEVPGNVKIVFATGSRDQFIHANQIDRPLAVIDVSVPRNVASGDVKPLLVVDAGVVLLPNHLTASGYIPKHALSCLVELILLSFENRIEDFSIGRRLWLRNIHTIGSIARRHGFFPEVLHSFGKPLEKSSLIDFRYRLNKKT